MHKKDTKTKSQFALIVTLDQLHTLFCGLATLLELPAKPLWWLADVCKWKMHALKWGQADADEARGRTKPHE